MHKQLGGIQVQYCTLQQQRPTWLSPEPVSPRCNNSSGVSVRVGYFTNKAPPSALLDSCDAAGNASSMPADHLGHKVTRCSSSLAPAMLQIDNQPLSENSSAVSQTFNRWCNSCTDGSLKALRKLQIANHGTVQLYAQM